MRDIKIINGKAVLEVIEVPMNELKVTWYDVNGEVVDGHGDPRGWLFEVTGPGVNTEWVRRVEFPPLSYTCKDEMVYAKVYQAVLQDK
jgi:hypothetical protein